MARGTSRCPGCSAGMPSGDAPCPVCGRSARSAAGGIEVDLEVLDHDDEVGPAPVVEPERSHGARNVAAGVAVAAAMIAAAVVVGRDSGVSSTQPEVTATAPVTSAAPPPTNTLPGLRFRQVYGRGPLLSEPTGTVLYGLTQDSLLVRIDLDEGDVTWRGLQLSDAPTDHQLLPRAGAVVVAPANRQAPRVVADTLTGTVSEGVFDGPILFGPGADELWLLRGRSSGDVYASAQRVKLDGTPIGEEVALPPLFVLGSDGAGAPLLWGASGTYRVDPDTSASERVSEQRLAGWGAAAFVDLGCDGGLPCHWRVRDRATGESRLLPEPVPDEALRALFDRGRVSPDGRWLARVGREGSSLQVIDLTTGATLGLVDETAGVVSDPAWSPDGRWLFWLGADQITAWRVGSPEAPIVVSDLPPVPNVVALTTAPPS